MASWVLIVLCFIGALAAYQLGHRKGAAWGKPALVLFVLCIVVLVGYRFTRRRGVEGISGPVEGGVPMALRSQHAQRTYQLGQALKGLVPAGSKILIISNLAGRRPGQDEVIQEAYKQGLAEGLGGSNWASVSFYGPAPQTAGELSDAIAQQTEGFDVIISVVGLPGDLDSASFLAGAHKPIVGAMFDPRAGSVATETVKGWVQGGLVEAAIVSDAQGTRLYTRNNPDGKPVQ